MTTMSLAFNGNQLTPVSHNSQIWLTSSELAKSLGYADEGGVRKIYNRYKDEFTATMSVILPATQIDPLGESKGLQVSQRIFSLRGCHLIAMFSRTAIAKEFRKWVLDILDKQAVQYGLKSLPPSPYISEAEASQFKKSLEQHCKGERQQYSLLYRKVYDYYGVTSYKHIPNGKMTEAARLIGVKLVAVKKPALPAEPTLLTFTTEELETIIADRVKAIQGELVNEPTAILALDFPADCRVLNTRKAGILIKAELLSDDEYIHTIDGFYRIFEGKYIMIERSKLDEMTAKQLGILLA